MNPQIMAGEQGRMKINSSRSPRKTAPRRDASKREREKPSGEKTDAIRCVNNALQAPGGGGFPPTARVVRVSFHSNCFVLSSHGNNSTASISSLSLFSEKKCNKNTPGQESTVQNFGFDSGKSNISEFVMKRCFQVGTQLLLKLSRGKMLASV